MNENLLSSSNFLNTNLINKSIIKYLGRLAIVILVFLTFQPAANAQRLWIDTIGRGSTSLTQGSPISPYVPAANYTYLDPTVSGVSPSDGQYAITNSMNTKNPVGQPTVSPYPLSYADQTYGWLRNVTNHTTTGTRGFFLLINAGGAHAFYQTPSLTVSNVTNAITVNFWALNLINNLVTGTFTVPNFNIVAKDATTGAVIATSAAADLAQVNTYTSSGNTLNATWQNFKLNFSANGHTKIIIQLVDNTGIGVGNDFALDDIVVDESSCTPPTAPVVGTTTQPTCLTGEFSGQVALSGLPTTGGAWTVVATPALSTVASVSADTVRGTTATTVMTGLPGGTYTFTVTNGTGCISPASLPATINYRDYVWSGTTSTVPTLGTNWVGGVAPLFLGAESITIPTVSSGNYPKLLANESVFDLNITGATASFNLNGFTLNVGCNIINSTAGGLLTYNSLLASTINWNGSTAQKYTGNGTVTAGTTPLGNMTVNNSGASTITIYSGPVDIYNALTLTKGSLAVDGTGFLIINSSQTQTAYVAPITTGAITGTVNVERYISGGAAGSGYRGYRLLSSPVWNYTNSSVNCYSIQYVNTTQNGNPGALTGGTGSGTNPNSNGFTITNPFGNPTLYLYNEGKTSIAGNYIAGKNIGITAVTSTSVSTVSGSGSITSYIPSGNGYIFYFIGNNVNLAYVNTRTIEPTTITATGTLNQGSIPVRLWSNISSTNLSYTTNTGTSTIGAGNYVWGLNQVGNPYASTISLEQLYTDNTTGTHSSTNIGNVFYELKEPGQNYVSYKIGGQTNSTFASQYIASGQGFLVSATSATSTLTFSENEKVSTQLVPSPSASTAGTPQALLLSVKHPAGNGLAGLHLELLKDSITNVQTGIYFSKSGSNTFNKTEDAIDLDGISPALYLSSYKPDGTRVCINELGDYLNGLRVKLFVKSTTTGQFHLGLADIKNIDTVYNVLLVDKLLKDSVDLRKVKVYDFNISTTDSTTFGDKRFELAISLKQLPPYKLLSFKGQKINTGVQLALKTNNEGDYTGFIVEKLSGIKFAALDSLQSNGSANYSLTDGHPLSGVNTYRLKQNGITGQITYSAAVLINYNDLNSGDVLSVFPNPAKGTVNINVNLLPGTFNLSIYNSMGTVVKNTSVKGNYWTQDISSYTPGTYVVEMYDSKGNFVGKTKFVKIQ